MLVLHVVYFENLKINHLNYPEFPFSKTSRALSFNFQDLPGPGKMKKKFQDFGKCTEI